MELDSRANHEVLHRIGDEDLPGLCQPSNTCADVNGDPGQIIVTDLTLAAVEPAPDVDPDTTSLFGDGSRGAHGTARPVEGCQKPVAEGFDLAAAKTLNFLSGQPIVTIQKVSPSVVPKGRGALRRADDVSEEHGSQNAIDLMFAPRAGEKLLDEIHGLVFVAGASAQVEVTGELDEDAFAMCSAM